MNVREEKKYIKKRLDDGVRTITLTYWKEDNPKPEQLQKLKEYAESQGCIAIVADSYVWPRGLNIINLLTHKRD